MPRHVAPDVSCRLFDRSRVGDVARDGRDRGAVVVAGRCVEDDDLGRARADERIDHVRADEPGRARDEEPVAADPHGARS